MSEDDLTAIHEDVPASAWKGECTLETLQKLMLESGVVPAWLLKLTESNAAYRDPDPYRFLRERGYPVRKSEEDE